jgi:putative hydrolase of the HAD superfamily
MTIIFDLGNVILPFDPLVPCEALSDRCGFAPEDVLHLIYSHNLEREFEEGKLDGDQFTRGVARVLGIELDIDWFRRLWADMFTENQETSALIRRLRPHQPLILLSNTNAWHFEHARSRYPIVREFEKYVVSYEVGALKPRPEIYYAVLRLVDTPGPVVFIDDISANVEGARACGLVGIQFQSAQQVERELRALGARLEP